MIYDVKYMTVTAREINLDDAEKKNTKNFVTTPMFKVYGPFISETQELKYFFSHIYDFKGRSCPNSD